MQVQIDYLMEFISIQGEILEEKTEHRQPELSDDQKKRLAHRGKKLNEFLLGQIENIFAPSTVMKWYSELISKKYNSVGSNQKKRGRKPVNEEIVAEILRLTNNNPSWGYDRITGVMKYLGYDVCASTVRNVLDAHGIVPDPERRLRGDWLQYLEYWNHYRPHVGLNGNMVLPYQQDADGEIQEISFLGGLHHDYRRVKQAA